MTASMAGVAGVALAAGAGTRLAPITDTIPKPLCPVGAHTLLDHTLARLAAVGADLAVNVHHHAPLIIAAIGDRAHVSHESPQVLGTAGALGQLRPWIAGRPAVVVNADTWCPGDLEPLLAGWDRDTVRVLVPGGGDFGPRSAIVGTLLPWRIVGELAPTPTGLYEVVWRHEHAAGRLDVIPYHGRWMDCGTPRQLLDANLAAVGDRVVIHPSARVVGATARSVVCADAVVCGDISDSVIMAGAEVGPAEKLHRAIRWLAPDGAQHTIEL